MSPIPEPLPPDALRERLSTQRWTAHNLELAPGVWTLPGTPGFIDTNGNLQSIVRLLSFVFPGRIGSLRIADLGCLEGGYSLGLARMGAEVVGIEVRPENIDKCMLVRAQSGLGNLSFVSADVKDFIAERFGTFDVVLALGILYHLDDPVRWLGQVAGTTSRLLFLDTHFAPGGDLSDLDERLRGLGVMEQRQDGEITYEGRWFREYTSSEERDQMLWASWSNPSSFWLTKQSLLSVLARSGFECVWEIHDTWGLIHDRLQRSYPRCRLAALKTATSPPNAGQ